MAAYCGSIGSVNVLEFVSTDLFDESQENPFLLQSSSSPASVNAKLTCTNASPTPKCASIRFAELPLSDGHDLNPSPAKSMPWSSSTSPPKRQSVVVPTPKAHQPLAHHQFQPPYVPKSLSPTSASQATRQSITIALPLPRQTSDESYSSSSTVLAEETELHKLLYSLAQLGLGEQALVAPTPSRQSLQHPLPPFQRSHDDTASSTMSAPTSPSGFATSSLWPPTMSATPREQADPRTSGSHTPTGTASLMFRALPGRQSRRMTRRQSKGGLRCSSAPSSPGRQSGGDDASSLNMNDGSGRDGPGSNYGYGSQPSSPQRSRGSVTFLTVKNLLRGGGALARTVRREQPNRRPTCMGTELTISSRLKRREKFQRPTVITDAYHRVSDMKLGTSPMKVKIKHRAFPETWNKDVSLHDQEEADPGMPSPKGQLRHESLITLETLDKIGTRHACPVQLIEEPLPDFSAIQPRVDAWNHYKKPKKTLRRPSAWLLGATATSTPLDLHDC